MQAQGIDKEYESEILGKQQHLRVDFESEMPCDNTGEKDKSHTKRYALEFYFVAGQTHRADERKHYDCLYESLFREQVSEPFHNSVNEITYNSGSYDYQNNIDFCEKMDEECGAEEQPGFPVGEVFCVDEHYRSRSYESGDSWLEPVHYTFIYGAFAEFFQGEAHSQHNQEGGENDGSRGRE